MTDISSPQSSCNSLNVPGIGSSRSKCCPRKESCWDRFGIICSARLTIDGREQKVWLLSFLPSKLGSSLRSSQLWELCPPEPTGIIDVNRCHRYCMIVLTNLTAWPCFALFLRLNPIYNPMPSTPGRCYSGVTQSQCAKAFEP